MALPRRLMIVEDNQSIAAGLCMLFRTEADFELVATSDDGDAALEMARLQRPDIILMDVNLAGQRSGIDVTRQILEELPETKVVSISAIADYEQAMEAAGAIAHFPKSRLFELPRLLRSLTGA